MTENTQANRDNSIALIATLNDAARHNIHRPQGHNRVVFTHGIAQMVGDAREWPAYGRQRQLLRLVMEYSAFTEDNDPHGERDFGGFEWQDTRCYWKIDYYDLECEWGSSDPADPAKTARVLTILRADEY